MKADNDYARGHETLADDALGRHISEMATIWHTEGRTWLGDGRHILRRLRILRARMAGFEDNGDHALRWAAENISQVMAALEGCGFDGRLPAVGKRTRVSLLAREICAHSELRLSARRLLTALETFETVEPMEAGEIWALNAALKLELGRAFADVCARVADAHVAGQRADDWADKLAEGANVDSLGDYVRPDAFYARLVRQLSRREMPGALDGVKRQAARQGVDTAEAAARAQSGEAQNALLLKNVVETLRTLERIDWRELSYALGSVHIWLMRDPAGVYQHMDFASRQMYITAVSRIASRAGISQDAVARSCVICASESQGRARHVGWHLVDPEGRERFIEILGADTWFSRIKHGIGRRRKYVYMGANVIIALGVLAALIALKMPVGLAVTGIPSALVLAQTIVNRLSAAWLRPRMLPRLDLDSGVPDGLRTLVVIPALLSGAARAAELTGQLETMAALEDSENVDFLLLGDFADSPRAQEPGDSAIAEAARAGIYEANARAGRRRFFYLQRRREFNEKHDRYMGRERKRGALMALNRLLLGGESEFDGEVPENIAGRYEFVITLDADTRVPPGSIRRLIGTLGHPLNRFDVTADGNIHGYAVLQPRMELSLSAVKDGFVRVMAGAGGFDAYQSAVSEAYWDISGEGVYAGKGIYDLRAFDARLRGMLPENAILSHDLLEGALAGAGYISDAPLYDGFPATLDGYLKRLHRWTRGDWQLVRYLGREVHSSGGKTIVNPLRAFDRWKIFANMFRSLSAFTGLATAILALWLGNWGGLALALLPMCLPALINRWSIAGFERALYRIAVWPSEAHFTLDAIMRTLYRVYASGRNMLEWVTSADAEGQRAHGHMYAGTVCAALCIPGLFRVPFVIPSALLGAAFALAPLWTNALQKPYTRPALTHADARYLRELARDTWAFFEDNVGENGLPPDNVQIEPPLGASMRTSPTNTGMYMASCVAAHELGFIGAREMLLRLARTVRSLEKLEKWRGHIFNWVDIQTLEPLRPRYVSTVDSGNLLGCMYACIAELEKLTGGEAPPQAAAEPAGAGADRENGAHTDDELITRALNLKGRIQRLINAMDFSVLYDDTRGLFHIGINTEQGSLSRSYYDLLGSEARLASFAAMMKGDAPPRHFASLGRTCVRAGGGTALVSWSGTMFEYFMPHLLMAAPRGSLLGSTLKNALGEQMKRSPDMPWGVSESGYYGFDAQLNYQYKAFGMPALALSGGDAGVIAPYATEMAAWLDPAAATGNLKRMQGMGFRGTDGFFEAVDCAPARLPDGAQYRIVKSYMAHHKGMALLGLANALEDDIMVRLFMNLPQARALSLLLEEKCGHIRPVRMPPQPVKRPGAARTGAWSRSAGRHVCPCEVLLMRGPDCSLMATADGGSRFCVHGMAVNRWRAHTSGQRYGLRMYVDGADMAQGRAVFEPGMAQWTRTQSGMNTTLKLCLSPEDGVLLQQATVENTSHEAREVEITGFFELALAGQADDEAHQGFRSLFVQSEEISPGALVFTRRRRDEHSGEPVCLSMISAPEGSVLSCTGSRREFLGRGYDGRPAGLDRPLSGAAGRVLDSCSALRARLELAPHSRKTVLFAVAAPENRAQVVDIVEKYRSSRAFERAGELSTLRARAGLEYDGVSPNEFFAFMRAAAYLAFPDAPRRVGAKPPEDMRGLWRMGISGDLPLVLLTLTSDEQTDAARQALKMCGTLRALGQNCDLAIICDSAGEYHRPLEESLNTLTQLHGSAFILDGKTLAPESRALLEGVAAVRLTGESAVVRQIEQLDCGYAAQKKQIWPENAREYEPYSLPEVALNASNGWGGFDETGVYVIDVTEDRPTPAPWVNILANPEYGALIAENGGGFIWHGSSREGRLTRWTGDPLRAGCEQIIYLRDERTGQFASLTPEPCGALPVRVRHSTGQTGFCGRALGIDYELNICCDAELPALYMRVEMLNGGDAVRMISLTGFVDWIMGVKTSRLTRAFSENGCAMCAGEMPGVGIAAFAERDAETCVNRLEFTGADGNMRAPEAMQRATLTWAEDAAPECECAGVPVSPCAALRICEKLDAGEKIARTFVIGWAENAGRARELIEKIRAAGTEQRINAARAGWEQRLGRLTFALPDKAMEVLVNRWLPYQTQVSRLWARAGFYQPGGAFGFRDQLQDMLALLDTDGAHVRGHILRCAAHQFTDGDVQHWWHEPYRGVRTHITDDMLFLPYITALYVSHTGDAGILDERVPYLKNVEIPAGAEDIYCDCEPSGETGTLREHCMRALARADRCGVHGLPLMGSGDWNDGMNRVGAQGRGESVWLGMFMCEVMRLFAPLSGSKYEMLRRRDELIAAVEQYGWDGQWYRRAYYDDGTPMGSVQGEECRIDLLSQAWAALSGLDEKRVATALGAAWELLVDRDAGIVRLLTPPFDDGSAQPGYIKGYLPGIRENGGQYTHAAVWLALGLLKTGDTGRAWRVLEMLMPANHSHSPESAEKYAVEPYVLAADIYGAPPNEGRGGWTWYTGSAAWLVYALREHALGLKIRGDRLRFEPHVPEYWHEVTARYVYGGSEYILTARRDCKKPEPAGEVRDGWITLTDDGARHEITLPLGR